MEMTRNLCAQIPLSLHAQVMDEKNALEQTLSQYVTQILQEHFAGGKQTMAVNKTLAFQIPAELDQRLKEYLADEQRRTGKKMSPREFILGLIMKALDEYDARIAEAPKAEN